jgi:hypothetical protein
MNFLQPSTYLYEIFICGILRQRNVREFRSSAEVSDEGRRRVMRLLIAIPALLTVSFGAWAFLVLVVLEH